MWSRPNTRRIGVAVVLLAIAAGLFWRFGPSLPWSRPVAPAPSYPPDLRQTASHLAQQLKADPSNAEAWIEDAHTLAALGDWAAARDAYRHAIDLGQQGASLYAGYGEMQVLSANGVVTPGAHAAFTAALAAEPKNDVARYYLALADLQAGRLHAAINAWLALAADLPDGAPMRDEVVLGIAEAAREGNMEMPRLPPAALLPSGQGDPRDAAAAGLVAHLRADPNDATGWLRLAQAYAGLGDTSRAVDALERASRLKPDDIQIKLQMVELLLAGLQPQDALPPRAVALLRQVQAVAPDEPKVLWYLGIVAAREGRPDEARRNWTRLLAELPPDSKDRALVTRSLAALPAK